MGLGGAGGSKTLAWGFAMVPHRLRVLVLLCFHARLFVDALWSPAGKWLTSWLSFVMSNCDVVIFPLVSWVRCGVDCIDS